VSRHFVGIKTSQDNGVFYKQWRYSLVYWPWTKIQLNGCYELAVVSFTVPCATNAIMCYELELSNAADMV